MPKKRTKEAAKSVGSRDVLPHGVKRTEVLKKPVPVVAPTEPTIDEARSVLIVNGEEFPIAEGEPGSTVEPAATTPVPTKPKKAVVRQTTTKTTKPKSTKAKVSKNSRVHPRELYDEEDFNELEMLAEDFISAHESLTGYMAEHDDPAFKMLNRAHPNFVRSLMAKRQPE